MHVQGEQAGELSRYVPRCLLERIARGVPHARVEVARGAVLFADISGFVSRVERIARQGPGALERLREMLGAVFGHFIERTYRSGGDVLKFAGDALVVVWTAREESLAEAVLEAARCALSIQQRRFDEEALPELRDVRLRIGISAGEWTHTVVGGEADGLALLPVGEPFIGMGEASQAATPGEVVLDARAFSLLEGRANGEVLEGGQVRLKGLKEKPDARWEETPLPPPPEVERAALRSFVPRTVLGRLEAGHAEWIAEVRPVTVLFANLQEPRLMRGGEREEVQRATRAVQEALATFEGQLVQMITDDKGIVFVCAFGLPPLSHEDDAERALGAALAMGEALRRQGLEHGIGVTTGRAFCGTYGASPRCEYGVLGDVVNMAARLMQRATGRVLCDEATARAARSRVEVEALPPVRLKGKSAPVALFHVLRTRAEAPHPGVRRLEEQPLLALYRALRERALVGRRRELEALRGLVERAAVGLGGALLVHGEMGLGKSTLVAALLGEAEARGLPCLVSAGESASRSLAYHAWRPLLAALLMARAEATSDTGLEGGLREVLTDHPHGQEWAPLLSDVLHLRLPDNEVTAAMDTDMREQNTRELLVHVLERLLPQRSYVVVFDEAQGLDHDSWWLVVEMRRRVPSMLLVLSGRGLVEAGGTPLRQLEATGATVLELQPLTRDESLALACRQLGTSSLPEAVAGLLYEKAEGHPLFTEVLVDSLRENGVLVVEEGQCRLTVEPAHLESVRLPDTLLGAAISRMDRCPPPQQLALKVASVVGRSFSYRLLHDVHPVEQDRGALEQHLEALVQRHLTRVDRREPELVYAFQHGLFHQAAYELLAASQRRALHRAVAEWYERARGQEPEVYPLLAWHWLEAGEAVKALHWLDQAGTSAWRRGARHEAVHALQQALALEAQAGLVGTAPVRHARWHRMLGEAAFESGGNEEAVQRYRHALTVLGQPFPTSRTGQALRLLWEVLRLGSASWWPHWLRPRLPKERRQRLAELGHCVTELARERFTALDLLSMIAASLMAVNLTERSRAYAVASDAYLNIAYLAGTLGLKRLSERMFSRTTKGNGRTQCNRYMGRSLIALGAGRLSEAVREAEEGLALAQRLGDRHGLATGISILGTLHDLEGRLEQALAQRENLLDVARGHGRTREEGWAASGMANVLSMQDRHQEALAWIRSCRPLLPEADMLTQIGCHGQWTLIYLRAGDDETARQEAELSLSLWERSRLSVQVHLGPLTDACVTFLTLWERALATSSPEAEELGREARRVSRRLDAYARQFPVGKSRAARVRGYLSWLSGRRGRARRAFAESLEQARRLSMEVDEACVLLDMARLGVEPSARVEQLSRAGDIFSRLGLAYDARRVRELLGEPGEAPLAEAA
jgi:class 3 adenylate cyclase/tetratricopeptide (TPR) repeat protein